MKIRVEVFPLDASRWIAVIDGPRGPFSTEATRPEHIVSQVDASIREVLGANTFEVDLVDDQGRAWSIAAAPAQQRRLGVAGE